MAMRSRRLGGRPFIGRSPCDRQAGVPMLLQRRNCYLSPCGQLQNGRPAGRWCRQTEILGVAGRRPKADWWTPAFWPPGQVVLDVGYQRGPEGGLQGRCGLPAAPIRTAGAVTPVPGGLGPSHHRRSLAKHGGWRAAERTLSCGALEAVRLLRPWAGPASRLGGRLPTCLWRTGLAGALFFTGGLFTHLHHSGFPTCSQETVLLWLYSEVGGDRPAATCPHLV